jgi:hypothetical protein
MDRKILLFLILIFNFTILKAQCPVHILDSQNIELLGNKHQFLIVYPSDKSLETSFVGENSQTHIVTIMTERNTPPDYSTGDIVKSIRESSKPLIILAEDKSATDVLETFIQYPDVKEKVECFYSINGLIRGAQYAEKINNPVVFFSLQQASKITFLEAITIWLTYLRGIFSDNEAAVYALNPEIRQDYLRKHDPEISQLSKSIRLFSIDTNVKGYGHLPYSNWIQFKK